MPKLNSAIYGADETGFATAVSSDALDVVSPGINVANFHGETFDQSDRSRGPKDGQSEHELRDDIAKATRTPMRDSRACTQGNHGKQGCK